MVAVYSPGAMGPDGAQRSGHGPAPRAPPPAPPRAAPSLSAREALRQLIRDYRVLEEPLEAEE